MKTLQLSRLVFLTMLTLSIFLFSNCNEDPPEPVIPPTPTAEEILTDGNWLLVESEYTSDNTIYSYYIGPVTAYNSAVIQNSTMELNFAENPNDIIVSGDYDIVLSVGLQPNDPYPQIQTAQDVA